MECCNECLRAGYTGEGEEIRCGNPSCSCHTPKEECCEVQMGDYRCGKLLPCELHTPTTDWRERFNDTLKQLFRDFPVGSERMFIAHVRTFLQSELTRTRQQTKKEIIERVEKIKEEIRKKEGSDSFSETGNVVYYYLHKILTHLKGE